MLLLPSPLPLIMSLQLGCGQDEDRAPSTPGTLSDGGAEEDPGPVESCGEVLFTASDGSQTSYTQAFTDGEEVLLDQDGSLSFCTGTWFVVLSVTARVDVVGLGTSPEQTVLSGGLWGTVIEVSGSDAQVAVDNLTLDRGSARGEGNQRSGGGLRCLDGAQVSLDSVVLSDNVAYDGAGLHGKEGCTIEVRNSRFTDNISTDDGGAIRVDDSTASITDSVIEHSQARDGGGLFSWDSDVSLDGVVFSDNRSTDSQGGAVLHYHGDLVVTDSLFSGNASLEHGGALSLFGDTVLDQVRFTGNSSGAGGAVFLYTDSATLQCTDCDFSDNSPDDVGLDVGDSYDWDKGASFSCDAAGCG